MPGCLIFLQEHLQEPPPNFQKAEIWGRQEGAVLDSIFLGMTDCSIRPDPHPCLPPSQRTRWRKCGLLPKRGNMRPRIFGLTGQDSFGRLQCLKHSQTLVFSCGHPHDQDSIKETVDSFDGRCKALRNSPRGAVLHVFSMRSIAPTGFFRALSAIRSTVIVLSGCG